MIDNVFALTDGKRFEFIFVNWVMVQHYWHVREAKKEKWHLCHIAVVRLADAVVQWVSVQFYDELIGSENILTKFEKGLSTFMSLA